MDIRNDKIKYFHFTDRENLDSILEQGLIPRIGKNAEGVEETKKIFFSEDRENALKCLDTWIKWFIVRYQKKAYTDQATQGINPRASIEDYLNYDAKYQEALARHHLDVETGAVETEEVKQICFKKMYHEWQDKVYLALDLEEDVDFSHDDVDEVKVRQSKSESEMRYIEYMYGKIDKIEGLEKWNMHAFVGKTIEPDKIEQLTLGNKTDGLSIVQEMYHQEKEQNPDMNLPMLDQWMQYVNVQQQQQTAEDEHQTNSTELTNN